MRGSAYSAKALVRSATHFVAGKAASALLGITTTLYLVRLLPLDQYAAYVTFLAAIEVALPISYLGMPWLAARYLPEFRLHASRYALRQFCLRLAFWQGLLACAFAGVLVGAVGTYLDWAGLSSHRSAAQLYVALFVIEGIGRFVREALLGSLLLQGIAQVSAVVRAAWFLGALFIFASDGEVDLMTVAIAELTAALLAVVVAVAGLVRHLRSVVDEPGTAPWKAPPAWEMWAATVRMYGSQLMTLCYSPQVLVNVVQRHLGSEAAATFGFLRALYEQVGRYLPATLFFSLVRPKLVASFVDVGSIGNLARNANFAGKLSLIVLVPAVAFSGVANNELVAWLAGGKFQSAGFLFFGLMLALVPLSQRQLLETVAIATGNARLCLRAALTGFSMPVLLGVLLALNAGLWSAVIVIGAGNLLFNVLVLRGMARSTGYRADISGFGRVLLAGVVGYLCGMLAPESGSSLTDLLLQGSMVLAGYLPAVLVFGALTAEDRMHLASALRHWRRS